MPNPYVSYIDSPFALEVNATANATTTSGTNALLTGMTSTPPIGTYLVIFSAAVNSNSAGATVSLSLFNNGTQKADSVRNISQFDGGALSATSASGGVDINGIVTVNGSQAIEIRWSTSGGTATCGPRTMTLLKVG